MNFDSHYLKGSPLTDCQTPVSGPQLELAFAAAAACPAVGRRQRRLSRASWWFQRMRQIVDRACDWQPVLVPRPEQIWLPIAHRTISLRAQSDAGQRQLCE